MKNIFKIFLIAIFAFLYSCAEELEINPQGSLSEDVIVYNEDWLDKQLISAYATLDGYIANNGADWSSPGSNWTFGDIPTDDVYKGSEPADQAELNEIEWFTHNATNAYFQSKWRVIFEGVNRCNQTLRAVAIATEEGIVSASTLTRISAEARFLRAVYHFDALKNFRYVPYITEEITESQPNPDGGAYSGVDTDLQFAIDNLPESQGDAGRATSWAAKAFLAKSKMYQLDHTAAAPILDDIINNGPYDLVDNYHENFNADYDNNIESVFAIQNSVNDGAPNSANGNYPAILAFTHNEGPVTCCGFYQPTQNLVNAFKTQGGLPMIDTFNDVDVESDQGIGNDEPFTPTTVPLDPRLDWTVGRRGIPYLGWDIHPGRNWVRDQTNGGPYNPKKHMFTAAQDGVASTTSGWTNGVTSINTPKIRFADILLWRAEIMAENNEGDSGMALVNRVRERAMTGNRVQANLDGTGGDAANYEIELYTAATFTDPVAMVRFERRLELAMEGQRLYDLVRWGVAGQVINDYIEKEQTLRAYLVGKSFVSPKNNYYPIPQAVLDASKGVMQQNPNY